MPRKTFSEGCTQLREYLGHGQIKGEVTVDQVYAHFQDGPETVLSGWVQPPRVVSSASFMHPRGGESGYLYLWTDDGRWDFMRSILARALTDGAAIESGQRYHSAVSRAMEFLAESVYALAPREYWLLRNSASARVFQGGLIVYDRPALVPRASQGELDSTRGEGLPASYDVTHEAEAQRQTHSGSLAAGGHTRALDSLRRRRAG